MERIEHLAQRILRRRRGQPAERDAVFARGKVQHGLARRNHVVGRRGKSRAVGHGQRRVPDDLRVDGVADQRPVVRPREARARRRAGCRQHRAVRARCQRQHPVHHIRPAHRCDGSGRGKPDVIARRVGLIADHLLIVVIDLAVALGREQADGGTGVVPDGQRQRAAAVDVSARVGHGVAHRVRAAGRRDAHRLRRERPFVAALGHLRSRPHGLGRPAVQRQRKAHRYRRRAVRVGVRERDAHHHLRFTAEVVRHQTVHDHRLGPVVAQRAEFDVARRARVDGQVRRLLPQQRAVRVVHRQRQLHLPARRVRDALGHAVRRRPRNRRAAAVVHRARRRAEPVGQHVARIVRARCDRPRHAGHARRGLHRVCVDRVLGVVPQHFEIRRAVARVPSGEARARPVGGLQVHEHVARIRLQQPRGRRRDGDLRLAVYAHRRGDVVRHIPVAHGGKLRGDVGGAAHAVRRVRHLCQAQFERGHGNRLAAAQRLHEARERQARLIQRRLPGRQPHHHGRGHVPVIRPRRRRPIPRPRRVRPNGR